MDSNMQNRLRELSEEDKEIERYKKSCRRDISILSMIFFLYITFVLIRAESTRPIDLIDKTVEDITTVFSFIKPFLEWISLFLITIASIYFGRIAFELVDGAFNGPADRYRRDHSSLAVAIGFLIGFISYGVLFVGFIKGLNVDLLQFVNK